MQTQEQEFEFYQLRDGLKSIYRYTEGYRKKLLYVFCLIITLSTLDAIVPFLWGKLADTVINGDRWNILGFDVRAVIVVATVYIGLLFLRGTIRLKRALEAKWVEENIRITYLEKNFSHVYKLPLSFHKSAKQGEINEKIRTAAQSARGVFAQAIVEAVPSIASVIIICTILTITNWVIGLSISTAVAIYVLISIREVGPTYKFQKLSQRGYRKAGGINQDAVTNIRTVKDFGTEEYEVNTISKIYRTEGMVNWYKSFRIQRTTGAIQGYIHNIANTIIIAISVYLIIKGSFTVGQMIMYVSYTALIFPPLGDIFRSWREIQGGIVAINDAEDIIKTETEVYHPEGKVEVKVEGNITFENVSFFYDSKKPVLNEINFEVKKGETIALVGESGVGKSTLIDLLSGYHFATEGAVLFEGVDVKKIALKTIRDAIAVVNQEVTLFNTSIENNLKYGNFEKEKKDIIRAATQAHCADFIEKFPEGWDQVVGEKGLKLSVGQKQRVAIARAILKDPKILILDEPTSALDAGTEKIITESLNELMKGRTTFIVAHRLSTVRRADRILVFKDGRIIEQGKHEELLKIDKGEYRRLYELQIGLHE